MSFQWLPNQVANITDIPGGGGGGGGEGYEKFQEISFPHPQIGGHYPARFFCTFAKQFILGTKLGAEGP